MTDIDDTARKTDAGTKLLNRQPSGSGSRGGKGAATNKPTESAFQAPGLIDDDARKTDAGTKLLNRQPAQKAKGDGKSPSTKEVRREPYFYPGATGENVWTWWPNAGNWVARPAAGWDASFSFGKMQLLLDGLKQRGLAGQVSKLAIVVHGDADGVVQFTPQLTPATLGTFRPQLSELGLYMKLHGKLIFLSCIAGRGPQGTTLLTGISKILAGVYVIGFEIFGGYPGLFIAEPGQVWEDQYGSGSGRVLDNIKNPVPLREYSIYSKWALNGKIIRYPQGEQMHRAKNKCANPTCPGHPNAMQQCDIFP